MSRHELHTGEIQPPGQIFVCVGQMCAKENRNNRPALEEELSDVLPQISFEETACLGNCTHHANIEVRGTIYERVGHNWTGTKISVVAVAVRESLGEA